MTREELCNLLHLSAGTPPADLAQAQPLRIAEIKNLLGQTGLPKPVKLKLHQECGLLESANALVAQLEIIGQIEAYFVEIEKAERAKPNPSRSVIRLCLDRLKPLVPKIEDEAARFCFEKRFVEFEERLGPERKPPPSTQSVPPFVVVPGAPAAAVSMPSVQAAPRPPPPAPTPARPVPPAATSSSPKSSLPPPAGGTLLRLVPTRSEGTLRQSGPPIHLVARPRFVVGRHSKDADFVTYFLPETEENKNKTSSISRSHLTLFLKSGQIWVQDGKILENGTTKKSSGTIIDGQLITTKAIPLNFTKERRIKLGPCGYEFAALHLPAVSPGGSLAAPIGTLSSQSTTALPPRALGCMRFLPITCHQVRATTVWIFSEAALGSGSHCAVPLDQPGLPPVAARFHHWQEAFWLEVPADCKSVVALDGLRLAAGEVRPLQAAHDHEFRLSDLTYELHVS